MSFAAIPEALVDFRAGKMLVVVDDETFDTLCATDRTIRMDAREEGKAAAVTFA